MPRGPKKSAVPQSRAKSRSQAGPASAPSPGFMPGTAPSLPLLGTIGNTAAQQLIGQTLSTGTASGSGPSDEEHLAYKKRKKEGKAREYVREALDYDSSDNESELDQDTFVRSLEQIISVKKPYQGVADLKKLSDRVGEERKDDGEMSAQTFEEVSRLHDSRSGVVGVRDNPILFEAHRSIIPIEDAQAAKKTRIPVGYDAYRQKFNTAVPKSVQYLMDRNGFEEDDIAASMQPDSSPAFKEMLESGRLDLRSGRDKPPALEHKVNKAGPQGYPIGQVRSRNLVLVNDDRKYDEGPHPMMHSIKAAEGSGKTNYSLLDDDAGAAIASGIRTGIRRTREERDQDDGSDTD